MKDFFLSFCLPFPFSLLLLTAGVILLWRTHRQNLGRWLTTTGLLILTIGSMSPFSNLIINSLEQQYPSLTDEQLSAMQDIPYIVVLGGGGFSNPKIPPTSQHTPAELSRATEGLRVARLIPNAKLILAGGSRWPISEAESMQKLLVALGLDQSRVVLEKNSKDTYDQALSIKEWVGIDPFILVTSAIHMPRAVALFRKAGLNPIPQTTNYLDEGAITATSRLPRLESLGDLEVAIYEYLGWFQSKILGRI